MRQRIVSAFKSRKLSLTVGTLIGVVTVPVLLLGTATVISASGRSAPDDPTPDPTPQPDPNYTDFVAPPVTVIETRNTTNNTAPDPITTPGVPYQDLQPVDEQALIARNNGMMTISNALMDAPDDPNGASIPGAFGAVTNGYWRMPQTEFTDVRSFIASRTAAIQLGKALFWDQQVGSDGTATSNMTTQSRGQACATCHFHAGADRRLKNQLNPDKRAVNGINDVAGTPDLTFQMTGSGASGGPNYTLNTNDFPFHKLSDPNNRFSGVLFDTNDVSGSQGVINTTFGTATLYGIDLTPGSSFDNGTVLITASDPFRLSGFNTRRTTARNTPTAINAVFNYRNFWDGRARNIFNGFNPFGEMDPNAVVLKVVNNSLSRVTVRLENSSLASQSTGPVTDDTEMSFAGRLWPDVGVKLLRTRSNNFPGLRPLANQLVRPDDSVLGPLASSRRNPAFQGLDTDYPTLIRRAFRPEWWNSSTLAYLDSNNYLTNVPNGGRSYSQMEANMSLFFGLAVQMYESTLVSDDSPFDRYRRDPNNYTSALTDLQKRGMWLFFGNKAKCSACHGGPVTSPTPGGFDFTNASIRNITHNFDNSQPKELLERMIMGDNGQAVYDNGFYDIGRRPVLNDLGVGSWFPTFPNLPPNPNQAANPTLPTNRPLSDTILNQLGIEPGLNVTVGAGERTATKGAFKTPNLRNVELTGPYFHDGGEKTLADVLDFYNRGGNFADIDPLTTLFLAPNIGDNSDPNNPRHALGLTPAEKAALKAFLMSLTDDRVRYQTAPFDHPALYVPNGHPGDQNGTIGESDKTGVHAKTDFIYIRATSNSAPFQIFPVFPQ